MAKQLSTDAANLALRAAAIVGVIYGIGFLLMPYSMLQLSGDPGVPTNSGWVRWAGGFVLGIAIGPWLASEGWVKEQPFIAGLAAAYTLSGLALLYSAVSGEYAGAAENVRFAPEADLPAGAETSRRERSRCQRRFIAPSPVC